MIGGWRGGKCDRRDGEGVRCDRRDGEGDDVKVGMRGE